MGKRRKGTWFFGSLAAAVVGGLAAFAAVSPATGTIGSQVTVDGSGFGEKKPKAVLDDGTKPIPLKVVSFSDAQVLAQVKKGRVGTFDVVVTPPGGEGVVFDDAFRIVLGTVDAVAPDTPAPKTEITVTGTNFGTKKGKVRVGGKPAKVTSWTDAEVKAVLHKKTPAGDQPLEVRNKIGVAGTAGPVTVGEGDDPGPGPTESRIDARIDRRPWRALGNQVVVEAMGTGVRITASGSASGGFDYVVVLDLSNVDLANLAKGAVEPALVEVTYQGTTWRAAAGNAFANRLVVRSGALTGDFEGTLDRVSGSGGAMTLEVLAGGFIAVLP